MVMFFSSCTLYLIGISAIFPFFTVQKPRYYLERRYLETPFCMYAVNNGYTLGKHNSCQGVYLYIVYIFLLIPAAKGGCFVSYTA